MRNLNRTDIIAAIKDRRLIGDSLSAAQEAALRVLYGLPIPKGQLPIFERATGQSAYQPQEYRESLFLCGRRAGKSSKLAANIAVYEACFRDHKLAAGERGHVVVLAATMRQAATTFNYISARIERSSALRGLITGVRAREIDLANNVTIAVWPADYRTVRGLSIVCAILEEVSFWYDAEHNVNPASEIIRAVRPAMSTFPNAKMIWATSPFAKQGVVWETFQKRHERGDFLVWHLGTSEMNPAISEEFLRVEEARDPEAYAREYLAQFWESATSLLPADAIQSCIVPQRFEFPPTPEAFYTAGLDAAFRSDNFAFSIVHRQPEGKVVQDVIRCWRGSRARPVQLAEVLAEMVSLCRNYGIPQIHGDQFCSEPIRQSLAAQGIGFEQCSTLGTRASGIWQSLRTLILNQGIELLDNQEQTAELKRLEAVVTSGGNQRIQAREGHDDRAVALALAAHQSVSRRVVEPWLEVIRIPRGPSALSGEGVEIDEDGFTWTRIS